MFRWLRHRAGLELSIAVLVTAEIIAKVYYAALRQATTSVVLVRLCDQILYDELRHVRFQCERLAILRARRSRLGVWLAGAAAMVFRRHVRRGLVEAPPRAVLGGYGLWKFRRSARAEMAEAVALMDPKNYVLGPVVDRREAGRVPAAVAG